MNLRHGNLQDSIVKLAPLQENDFDDLFKVASDPHIWEQHPSSDRYKPEVFKLFFDGAIKSQSAFKIIDSSTNEIIGSTRFYDFKPNEKSIAIGYTFLAKDFWGGKYNKATKKILMDYAFQFVDSIYFHIGWKNIRSQKAIANIGATKVREVDIDYYGRKLLHFEYVVTKQEWLNN